MGLRLMCAAGVAVGALLLLLLAAIARLLLLLVQLVTPRYTLALCLVAATVWFVDSRRQRYAKGFYSCSHVPTVVPPKQPELMQPEEEQEQEQTELPVVAPVAPVQQRHSTTTDDLKKTVSAPPSETESEDDSEASAASAKRSSTSSGSGYSQSLCDVRSRSNTTDGELQRRLATRPRSSSAATDRTTRASMNDRPRAATSRGYRVSKEERKRRVPRRRAETGVGGDKHKERSRRATFTSKQDAYMGASRSSSEMLEDALRSDGYWIGDFSVQRRLVSRRSHTNSPKAG